MSLNVAIKRNGNDLEVALSGTLDEDCQLPEFAEPIVGKLVIQLEHLRMLNSLGCRKWAMWWREKVPARGEIQLAKCSPAVVNQISILKGFVPEGAKVTSFYTPYLCASCNHEDSVLLILGKDFGGKRTIVLPEQKPCPKCNAKMEIEVDRDRYLRYFQNVS